MPWARLLFGCWVVPDEVYGANLHSFQMAIFLFFFDLNDSIPVKGRGLVHSATVLFDILEATVSVEEE